MEKIIKCMSLPKAARDELGISDDGTMPEPQIPQAKYGDDDEDEDPVQAAESAKRVYTQRMQYELYG
jgi:hypothetical protein